MIQEVLLVVLGVGYFRMKRRLEKLVRNRLNMIMGRSNAMMKV
jgi:hypothetical protein